MGRAHRADPPDGWHHVMSRGVDRQAIFFDPDDRCLFGDLLGEMVGRFRLEIHAYCLMTNHFHLLVRCPDSGLSDGMQWLLSMYASQLNQKLDRVGHLFGGRFTSRLVADTRYLANVVRYIHLNPLDIAGVRHPGDYRWSSHRTYIGLRPAPRWFTMDVVSRWFSDGDDFERFVVAPIAVAPPTAPVRLTDGKDLLAAIDLVMSEHSPTRARRLMAERRAVAIAVAESMTAIEREEVFDILELPTAGARRTANHRARQLRQKDPLIDELCSRVRQFYVDDLARRSRDAA